MRCAFDSLMLTKTEELKNRVEAKRHLLQARLAELKADTRSEAAEMRASIKKRLDEAEEAVKDGWDKLSDAVASKLNQWLDKD